MIKLYELLATRGFNAGKSTKIIKHQDPRIDLGWLYRNDRMAFDVYQSDQSRPVFNCDQIISCVQNEYGTTLVGIYSVLAFNSGSRHRLLPLVDKYCLGGRSVLENKSDEGGYVYRLQEESAFFDLSERVIVDWGTNDRSWHQWYTKEKDKEVTEVLPMGYVMEWPGYLDVLIDWADLNRMANNQPANRHWINPLSAISGVYLIQHVRSGDLYVGSATGEGGLWGRWSAYAQSGHGNNVMLEARCRNDVSYKNGLKFSILHVLPKACGSREVLYYEKLYKEKLGSRAFGLNLN